MIQFLKQKRKGVYTMLVQEYAEMIASMPIVMALEIIREDLQKDSGESIELNYFSLARAIARFKKKNPLPVIPRKLQFKDANEIDNTQSGSGRFKLR